jgi:regulator of replication initiation timing
LGFKPNEENMPIELLYIIPIVALAMFIGFLVFSFQKKNQGQNPETLLDGRMMGDTKSIPSQKLTEERLSEFESTINAINLALNDQQKVIEQFQTENNSCSDEMEKLRSKLRDLHKEYDIVISENYSLRAKVKSLQKKVESAPVVPVENRNPVPPASPFIPQAKEHSEMNMNLYEDTRLFKSSTLDDTREYDISEVK